MELVRTVLLDRVVEWHKAEIEVAAVKGKGKGSRQPARGVKTIGVSDGGSVENAAAAERANAERVSSVWSLLAKAGQGDAHKCLKKVQAVVFCVVVDGDGCIDGSTGCLRRGIYVSRLPTDRG